MTSDPLAGARSSMSALARAARMTDGQVVVLGILDAPPMYGSTRNTTAGLVACARDLAASGADVVELCWAAGEATVNALRSIVAALVGEVAIPIAVAHTLPNPPQGSRGRFPPSPSRARASTATQFAAVSLEAGASILYIDDLAIVEQISALAARGNAVVLLGPERANADVAARARAARGEDIVARLREAADRALAAGVSREAVWLDTTVSGDAAAQAVLCVLPEVVALGFPTAVEPELLARTEGAAGAAGDSWEEAAAVLSLAVAGGARVVRVRDVKRLSRVARMAEAIGRAAPGSARLLPGHRARDG